MSRGRLEQIASPQQLYDAPDSAFVADFVGTMNRLRCRVVDGQIELGGEEIVHYRPHEVELVASSDATLTGRVVARFFLGGVIRYIVELDDGQRLQVEAFSRSIAAVGEWFGLRFGQSTEVGKGTAANAHMPD